MKNFFLLICLAITSSQFVTGQDAGQFQKKWMVQGGDTMPYRLLLPKGYDGIRKFPLLVFLHGSGERGRDNEKQLVHGSKLFLREDVRTNYPAIIVFPQCSNNDYWSNVMHLQDESNKHVFYFPEDGRATEAMDMVQELVKYLIVSYPVQKNRVYAGGLSMGGMGTFELVRRMPKTFAAAFAICGGANPSTAKEIKDVKWWIFHGLKDDVVPPIHSRLMEAALKKKGANIKATYYPNANHNSWDSTFAEPGLLPWLFAQSR
ncbi:MAG: prolyl oligopeptidase family serine peptidase [Ferruginibacter sp.]